ncbi:MAG: peptide chain release factor N(5)-glutamine methyltransferase [Nitrospirae bacterium]|nr:peptide chain release factor N(5)-glutamine methyltransferase [Nitrospirota bacterium]
MRLRDITALLKSSDIDEPQKEAEELMCLLLNTDRTVIYLNDPSVDDEKIIPLIRLRQQHQPLAYIAGEVEFYGLRFTVGTGVLIPRPETELLVEKAIERLSVLQKPSPNVLDLCTGSGCIALSIARAYPHANVIGIDISDKALGYAITNSTINNVHNVVFLNGDLFAPLKNLCFDLIISNPPYIARCDIQELQPEIRLYEPIDALDGGVDALDFYRRIMLKAKDYLSKDGLIMFELGDGQAADVKEMALSAGFETVVIKKDYSQKDRFAIISKSTDHK